jgi:eukaryotic-like serine/threonine-protein kinase
MSAILREDPPDLTATNQIVPPVLERIVRHCLEKNPEERFQSARDVAFALGNLSGSSGTNTLGVGAEPKRRFPLHRWGSFSWQRGCCSRFWWSSFGRHIRPQQ